MMKNILFCAILLVLVACAFPSREKITIFLAGDSTMAEKEISAYPETGWGMPFRHFWDSSVQVVNKAKNGRSTKTFISEGLWASIISQAKQGDYIFIQFGHNDESPDKIERYTPPDTFVLNLARFVKESRAKGATPILLSPVSRRQFDSTGRVKETHKIYTALVQKAAAEMNVTYIDLDAKSRELYQQFGPDNSKLLFLQLRPGENPNYPNGRNDNTHFNELGARLIAQIILGQVREKLPVLAERIVVGKR